MAKTLQQNNGTKALQKLSHSYLRVFVFFAVVSVVLFSNPVNLYANSSGVAELPVRGVVRAEQQADISTDITELVAAINFREGDAFKAGDVLVKFDCRRREAELTAAKAQLREMEISLQSNKRLQSRQAASRYDVQTAQTKVDKAAADVEKIKMQLARCEIIAPYDGRIGALAIHEHEMSASGKFMLSIYADGDPEIELIAPSSWLTWLKPGTPFRFQIDETQTIHRGVVDRLGANIDTVSQTIIIYAKFSDASEGVLPGMSGVADFRFPEMRDE